MPCLAPCTRTTGQRGTNILPALFAGGLGAASCFAAVCMMANWSFRCYSGAADCSTAVDGMSFELLECHKPGRTHDPCSTQQSSTPAEHSREVQRLQNPEK
jgi:hypothetical protein